MQLGASDGFWDEAGSQAIAGNKSWKKKSLDMSGTWPVLKLPLVIPAGGLPSIADTSFAEIGGLR